MMHGNPNIKFYSCLETCVPCPVTNFFPQNIQYIGLLFQDISRVYVEEYGKHLQSALNLGHANARLFSFCCTSLPEVKQPQVVYQWPVRCRRRPLIKQPHQILDLPNFKAEFCMC